MGVTMVGNPGGRLLPPITFILDIPTRPEDIAKRHHNKIVREAITKAAEQHHARHIPEHFKATNRQRYNHAPRTEKYKRYKLRKYGSRTDLVKAGRTRSWMTRAYKLRVGGNAEAGTIKATLILTFPFKGGSGSHRSPKTRKGAVAQATIQQMIREMETFSSDEPRRIAEWFSKEYMNGVEKFRAGRIRKRIPVT